MAINDMSPEKKTRNLILILVLYVVIALVGFFIVYFIKITFFNTKSPTSPTTQTTKISPPASWKTYENKANHLAVAYPSDFTVTSKSYPLGITNVEMRSADNTNSSDAANVQILTLPKTIAMAAGQDFNTYYSLPDNTTKTISQSLGGDKVAQKFTKLSNITVEGHRAFRYRSIASDAAPDDEAEIGIFIENDNNLILMSAGESDQEQLDKMLQTIQLSN